MRILVFAILGSVMQSLQVLGLLGFISFGFGVIAIPLFKGALRQRCTTAALHNATDATAAVVLHNVTTTLSQYVTSPTWDGVAVAEAPFIWLDRVCGDRLGVIGPWWWISSAAYSEPRFSPHDAQNGAQ